MAKRFCCKSPRDNKYKDCSRDQYDDLPNNMKKVQMNGEPCEETKPKLSDDEKQKKAEKCGHASWEDYKNSGWECSKSVTPSPGTSGYKECADFYQLNCKDTGSSAGRPNTNGPIYKVQGCIGVKQDSFFGPKTQSALQAKIGKNYFTEDQVEAICKGEVPGGTSPAIEMPLTQEQKEQYWNDLIEKERIYDQGLIHTLKDGNVVYIVKTELNNPDVKLPLGSLKDADLTVNDFIVMYPIKKGEPRGKFGLLTKYKTPSGEEKVKIETNPRWYWSPEEEVESIDMFESKITNILKNVLSEQKFYGRIGSTQQGSTTTTGGSTSQTQQGTVSSQNTTTFDRDSETIKAVGDIKNRAIEIIDSWDQYNDGLKIWDVPRGTLKGELNKNIDGARNEINSVDPKDFCDTEIQKRLDLKKKELETQKKENAKLLTNEDKVFISQLEGIFNEIKVACKKVDDLESQSLQGSQGSQTQQSTQTQQVATPSQQTTQGSGTQPGQNQNKQKEEETPEVIKQNCKDLVLSYVHAALKAADSQRVKGPNIKKEMCECFKTGDLEDIELVESDFTGKYRLNSTFTNYGALNKKLKWKEIVKLIRNGKYRGFVIGKGFIDDSFGVREGCVGYDEEMVESLKSNVKTYIREAINKKKTLTESIVNRITRKIG